MTQTELGGLRIHVHAAGDCEIDRVLRLNEEATASRPLGPRLQTMCELVAQIACVDVVSVYVRESSPDGPVLTMRGNVGFPQRAIGSAQLRLGEGITGFVADCLRPVSAEIAPQDEHYRHIDGLGEERFPAFLGVPLIDGDGTAAAGVLVVQRRLGAFSPREVTLVQALAIPFALAIQQDSMFCTPAMPGRAVRLSGRGAVGGTSVGRAVLLPTLAALSATRADIADPQAAAVAGLRAIQSDLDHARERVRCAAAADPAIDRALLNLGAIVDDQRFVDKVIEETGSRGLVDGLLHVSRDYARAPYRVRGRGTELGAVLHERASEIEDLCALVFCRARQRRFLHGGSVVVAPRLGAIAALCALARQVAAIVVESPIEPDGAAAAIIAALGRPVVAETTGLAAIAAGDLLAVDGDGGKVDVNPSQARIAKIVRR